MLLGELIADIEGVTISAPRAGLPADAPSGSPADPASVRICDLTEDSRTALPGSLFIARPGLTTDGRRYAADAVRAGAVAILTDDPGALADLPKPAAILHAPDIRTAEAHLAERFYGNPSAHLRVIAVTGTNGKTTVVSMVHRLLNAAGVRTGLIGTVEIDDGTGPLPAEMTTPPAIELSRTMAVMRDNGCQAVAMEASSHALDQRRADAINFDTAVFTNLTGDHIDYHGSHENYLAAKRRLFELLHRSAADNAVAITNAADPASPSMTSPVRTGRVLNCAFAPANQPTNQPAHWTVRTERSDTAGTTLHITGTIGDTSLNLLATVALVGEHNAMNLCQATTAAAETLHALGTPPAEIPARLERALTLIEPPAGRLEPVHTKADRIAVFVDYAHTDDALSRTLAAVRAIVPTGNALRVVFGAGGDRDNTKRPRMGEAAAALADRVIVTSDNPRTESPSAIITQILAGIPDSMKHKAQVQADRAVAIQRAIAEADDGDVIVIAGKGHETEQILPDGRGSTTRIHFDDREHARNALTARRQQTQAAPAAAPEGINP